MWIVREWKCCCDDVCFFVYVNGLVDEILFNFLLDADVLCGTMAFTILAVSAVDTSIKDLTACSLCHIEKIFSIVMHSV